MKGNQTRIGIITQARMTSTRLPGKILKEINHKTLLQYHLNRLQQTGFDVVIATTTNNTDNPVCEFADAQKISFYRGSEQHVLSRYFEATEKFQFDIIVRVTSDCPLIDPHLIRNNVEKYIRFNNPNLYMSNAIERTFARGFDFEIFSFPSLKEAFENTNDESDIEHVTPYLWKNKSGKVDFYHVKQEKDNSHLRVTVDTVADFELIKQLIEKYHAEQLTSIEIENLLIKHPELVEINANIVQKKI